MTQYWNLVTIFRNCAEAGTVSPTMKLVKKKQTCIISWILAAAAGLWDICISVHATREKKSIQLWRVTVLWLESLDVHIPAFESNPDSVNSLAYIDIWQMHHRKICDSTIYHWQVSLSKVRDIMLAKKAFLSAVSVLWNWFGSSSDFRSDSVFSCNKFIFSTPYIYASFSLFSFHLAISMCN